LVFPDLAVFPTGNRTQSKRRGKHAPIRVLLAIPLPMGYHAHLESAAWAP